MSKTWKTHLTLVKGDLTKVRCDAIVNAANPSLLRGGGLDGQIHKKAGRELESECQAIGKCPVGEVRLTKAYGLEEQEIYWVLHAVGPRWLGGEKNEASLLKSTYRKSLEMAVRYDEIYYKQMKGILKRYFEGERLEEELEQVRQGIQAHPIRTVAFPAIGTGVYRYPLEEAVQIAVETIREFINEHDGVLKEIKMVCYDELTYETFYLYLDQI